MSEAYAPEDFEILDSLVAESGTGIMTATKAVEPDTSGTIGEGGRHHHATRLAGKLRRAGCSPQEIGATLRVVSRERYRPPLPDGELDRIARDIGAKPTPEKSVEPVRVLTAQEFETDVAPRSIIDGLLFEASTTTFNGASKAGKTWAALQAAMCAAAGMDFLGLPTRPVRVLLCSLELAAGMVRERMLAISHNVGIPMPVIGDTFHVLAPTAGYLPHLDLTTDDGAAELRRIIGETRAGLVVLDTLYRFAPGADPSDNGEMGLLFGRLNDLAQGTGAALLILDHVRKGDLSGSISQSGLGATVKGGASRVVAGLKRTSKEDGGRWELDVESHFGS